MTMLHGIEVKVGDKVFNTRYGWSEVSYLCNGKVYAIESNHICSYMSDGKYHIEDKFPTLFWQEFEIPKEAYIKPLHQLEVDTKVLVWNSGIYTKERRYFSHFTNSGRIYCFNDGVTGWGTTNAKTTSWDNWELYKEEN